MELDASGDAVKVVPLYSFDFKALNLSTTCAPAAGAFPCTTPEGERRRCGRPCYHSKIDACKVGQRPAAPVCHRGSVTLTLRIAAMCSTVRKCAGAANWTNTERLYGNAERIYGKSAAKEYTVPCENGSQHWQNVSVPA